MEPQTDNKSNFLQVGLLELLFLVTLVTIILVIFNYFNIIPLYSAVPQLSFLPHQELNVSPKVTTNQLSDLSPTPFQFAGKQTKQVISSSQAQTFQSNNKVVNYIPLFDSNIDISGKLNIDIEMFIQNNNPVSTKATNGFLFSNGKTGTPEWRSLNILYFSEFNTWTLQYTNGNKSEYYPLDTVYTKPAYGKFTITILDDGTRVIITEPEKEDKVFDLPDSLYSESKKFNSVIMVNPGFEVQVPLLSYYY